MKVKKIRTDKLNNIGSFIVMENLKDYKFNLDIRKLHLIIDNENIS